MSLDILGPASALNSVTSRPASTTSYGPTRTWFKPCSSDTDDDGTQLTADWLNLFMAQARVVVDGAGVVQDNADDMLWRAIQVMVPRYAVDTGSANTLVIANSPPLPGYRAGLMFAVKVAVNNNGASTIAVDGLPPASIVDADGNALIGGELAAGRVTLLEMDDALRFRMVGPQRRVAITGYNNLIGSSAGSVKTASFTIGAIIADAPAGRAYRGDNLTLSFNGATTGANGMDTGSFPTAADLSIYAIYNPSSNTWAALGCLGSTSSGETYSGANMPAGYTASKLIHAGVTSGGNFRVFNQVNRKVYLASINIINGGGAVSPTSVSMTAAVPVITKEVGGNGNINEPGSSGGAFLGSNAGSGSGGSGMVGLSWFGLGVTTGVNGLSITWGPVPVVTPQTIYYYVAISGNAISVAVDWYKF